MSDERLPMFAPIQFMTHLHPRPSAEPRSGSVQEFDVVVVGAGPAGLASAITLGSYGVETLVIDKRTSASTMPRATVASTATVELLRRWGLEDAARDAAVEVEWRAWACETLASAGEGEAIDVGLPTSEQAALISPVEPLCIGQDELEPLMEKRAGSYEAVTLERGVELVDLERGHAGYLLTLSGPGGRVRRVSTRFLIGADGMRSSVRRGLGIATDAQEDLEERISVLLRAPLWDLAGEHRYGIYFMANGTTFLPAGKPDRWVWASGPDARAEGAGLPSASEAAEWVREAAGIPHLPVEVDRVMPVSFGVALAERFRDGDAFLIGDAAHRVTPRGGTGMNTAIRDGFDIAWKLAWVLRGWADDPLLDTYERERRPLAKFNTDRSTRTDGSILPSATGINADIGGRISHVWVPSDEGMVSTLDMIGEALTLFVGPEWEGTAEGVGGVLPTRVRRLDAISARTLGLTADGVLAVRPDGMPTLLDNGGTAALRALRKSETLLLLSA